MSLMTRFIAPAAAVAIIAALILALPTPEPDLEAEQSGFAITHVRVFDGQRFHEDQDVIVQNGKIAAVGTTLDISPSLRKIPGNGRTLLPGLIDAHVHTFGRARQDALRFGVTTLVDMFTSPEILPEARQQRGRADETRLADLYSAGMLATASGGHGTQFGVPVTPVQGPELAASWVDDRLAEGSDFIKIVIEPGGVWGRSMPTLDPATVRALVSAANERGVIAVAHVSTMADAQMAIEAGVDGLVHVFVDQRVSQSVLELAREKEVFVIPTAIVMAGAGGQVDAQALSAEPGVGERLSDEQQQSLAQDTWMTANGSALLDRAIENTTALHQAGVPLVAGSDAPNPGTAHGISLHQELELLVRAGLSAAEALAAATESPAEVFGLEGRGCLKPGCRADMVLIDGDPRIDVTHTRRIDAVWKNGFPIKLEREASEPPERPTVAVDLLDNDEIGRWIAADDSFMGGNSSASVLAAKGGQLRVEGELKPGAPFPYAGVMWSPGQPFMTPVDLAGRKRLDIGLQVNRSDGAIGWMAMLFSGASPGSRAPMQVPLTATPNGAQLSLDLQELDDFDAARFQALGIFAVGTSGQFEFELIEVRLQ